MPTENVPTNAKNFGELSALAIENEGTLNEIWKARFLLKGHKDSRKSSVQSSIIILLHDNSPQE